MDEPKCAPSRIWYCNDTREVCGYRPLNPGALDPGVPFMGLCETPGEPPPKWMVGYPFHTDIWAGICFLRLLRAGGRLSTAPGVHRDTARRIAREEGIVRVNGRPRKAG